MSCRAQAAVVEVHRAVGPHQAHAGGTEAAEGVVLGEVLLEQAADQGDRVTAPGHHLVGVLEQFGTLVGRERLVHAAGDRTGAMHALAGRHADHFLAVFA
jgi:hypothetical protein